MTPDPKHFETALEKALCVLDAQTAGEGVDAATISRILHDTHGENCHWRTVGSALNQARDLASRRKKDKRWRYTILEKGRQQIRRAGAGQVILVEPSKAVQNVMSLHDTLATLQGTLKICDPYLDAATIEHLDSCGAQNIRLLTHNIHDTGRLRSLLSAFSVAGRTLEVRKTSKAVLHDRYMIDKTKMLILGTSLNGFGKKECFVIAAGQDVKAAMVPIFDSHWSAATVWP
jgi:hypothetical protein